MNEGSGRPGPFCWMSQDACSGGRVGPTVERLGLGCAEAAASRVGGFCPYGVLA